MHVVIVDMLCVDGGGADCSENYVTFSPSLVNLAVFHRQTYVQEHTYFMFYVSSVCLLHVSRGAAGLYLHEVITGSRMTSYIAMNE